MLDIENMISLLRDAIEEQDWRIVEQVLEILTAEIDNPLDAYSEDEENENLW
jgi:hypothetical protein|tara:strand:- start:493 stop:648 length:156 start_codon:yes stop_codon:yes gene_type:complete